MAKRADPSSAEKRRRGMEAKAKEGMYLGGPVPFGYELDEWNQLKIREDQAEIVREMYRLRQQGISLNAIANRLNAQHVPTAQGGEKWYPGTVHRVLSNPIHYKVGPQWGKRSKLPETRPISPDLAATGFAAMRAARAYAATGILRHEAPEGGDE